MKKTLIIALVISLFAIAACSKNGSVSGGSWTFRSQTFKATFSNWIRGRFTSGTGTNYPTGSLAFRFNQEPDSIYPQAGTYTATNLALGTNPTPDPGFVYILMTDTSYNTIYIPTNSVTTQVTVSRTNGKLSITVPPVMMFRAGGAGADSGLLEANIVQTP